MAPEIHMMVGGLVLLIGIANGIWTTIAAKRAKTASTALFASVVVMTILLLLQVLLGLDLFSRGLRPAQGILAIVHMLGPIIALVVAVVLVFGNPQRLTRRYIPASHLTAAVAVISYIIGEMGTHQ